MDKSDYVSPIMAGGAAIDQAGAPADYTKAIYWFGVLLKCARLLDVPDDEPIPQGVLDRVTALVAVSAGEQQAPTQPQAVWSRADFIEHIILAVAEIPDRDSPEDQPEMMLVSDKELRNIIEGAFERADEDGGLAGSVAAQQAGADAQCPKCMGFGWQPSIYNGRESCGHCQPVATVAAQHVATPTTASPSSKDAGAEPSDELLDMLGRIHPFAMNTEGREKAYERLERAFVIQQPWPVPDQACIVWRGDLMDMRYDLVHKQAVFESWKRERANQSLAARDVLAERLRQVEKEGRAHVGDDAYVQGELGAYAAFYAMPPGARDWPAEETGYGATWGEAIIPADWTPPKPGDRRRELVKAGALILAEIERLDRAAPSASQSPVADCGAV